MPNKLGYTYLFLAQPHFNYNENIIVGASIDILFEVFNKNGEQVSFTEEKKIILNDATFCCLSDLLQVSINKDTIYGFSFKPQYEKYECSVAFREVDYSLEIFVADYSEPIIVSKEEFISVLSANKFNFLNKDNISAQVPAYFIK